MDVIKVSDEVPNNRVKLEEHGDIKYEQKVLEDQADESCDNQLHDKDKNSVSYTHIFHDAKHKLKPFNLFKAGLPLATGFTITACSKDNQSSDQIVKPNSTSEASAAQSSSTQSSSTQSSSTQSSSTQSSSTQSSSTQPSSTQSSSTKSSSTQSSSTQSSSTQPSSTQSSSTQPSSTQSSSTQSSSTQSSSTQSSTTQKIPSIKEAARFLHQAQFHASDEDIAAVTSQGFENWLNKQIAMPIGSKGWDWLLQQGYNEEKRRFDSRPMDFMLWNQLITAPDSVRKRVALALSEILVVSGSASVGSKRSFVLAGYWDLLNKHALGNYRDLLEEMSLNLAMGYYLNTLGNRKERKKTKRQPDENYARELLQLFTIGLYKLNMDGTNKLVNGKPIETYSNKDIVNLARVFTGYIRSTQVPDTYQQPDATRVPMQLNPIYHSTKEKQFLGLLIPANTAAAPSLKLALDHIFNHPNVPPFISKQLIQRLVTSNPSPAYVERVANTFANNGKGVRGDMKAVIKAILLDAEARADVSSQPYGFGKLREPMLRVLQLAKTFKATSPSGQWAALNTQHALGQSFLRPPSVFNFFRPGYVPPNTKLAENNLVAPEFQITTETNNINYFNYMRRFIERGLWNHRKWSDKEIIFDYSTELALVEKPRALVARLDTLLTANQLSAETIMLITNTIASMKSEGYKWKERRVWSAVWLVMCSPEYIVQK